MRTIYSTPRLENAERVAALLEADGIGVRVLFGPHFRRSTWRGVNYQQAQNPGNWPRVLVLNNGDLPRARALLREAGVMAPAVFERRDPDSEPALRFTDRSPSRQAEQAGLGRRLRPILIGVLILLALIQAARYLWW